MEPHENDALLNNDSLEERLTDSSVDNDGLEDDEEEAFEDALQEQINDNNNNGIEQFENHSVSDDDDTAAMVSSSTASAPHPAISQHSYLPGASHPLHTQLDGTATATSSITTTEFVSSEFTKQHQRQFHSDPNREPFELIIIELPGVVLFPGMTIPLRLEEPGSFSLSSCFWKLYQQIQQSRRWPGSEAAKVQVGVLTKLDPNSFSLDDDDDEGDEGEDGNMNMLRRRSSWMRRGFGPERLRRFSEQLIRDLGDIEEFLENVESVDAEAVDGPIPMVPLDPPPPQPQQQEQPPDPRVARVRQRRSWLFGGRQRRSRRFTSENQQPQQGQEDNDNVMPSQQEEVEFRLNRRRGPNRGQQMNASIVSNDSSNGRSEEEMEEPKDPYTDRIGTLATITFTHGDDEAVAGGAAAVDLEAAGSRDRPRERASLVLTAVGTGRFRILPNDNHNSLPGSETDLYRYRMFVRTVQEWCNERMSYMPLHNPPLFPANTSNSLASVSVWPQHVYDHYWPWSLVRELRHRMETVPCLNEILISQAENVSENPMDFSYWLARHLPLSERERLQVLLCPTVTERLRWYLRHSLFEGAPEQQQQQPEGVSSTVSQQPPNPSETKEIICKCCQIPIAQAIHLFTLGGAEGTVGNYVNPHGVVHATMTVREVDNEEVSLHGYPETQDSWFPGYAWTVMSCSLCHSHLGWKFTLVDNRNNHKNNNTSDARPPYFYGLSSTSVNLVTNPRRPQRSSFQSLSRRIQRTFNG